jgi:predicted component of type VI protein secretion system
MSDDAAMVEQGWALRGRDGEGRRLQLLIGLTELARAELGITLGRHPALADRTLADPSISRRHCRLSAADGRLMVEDLNSLNGTAVDGRLIPPFAPTPLAAGQSLELGAAKLRVARLDVG